MFCPKCGASIDDPNATFCPFCGQSLAADAANVSEEPRFEQQQYQQYQQPQYQQPQTKDNPEDTGGAGFGVLGFFIPLVGLILFLVWRKDFPKRAKGAGIGALIGVILYVIVIVICYVVIFTAAGALASSLAVLPLL